MEPFQVRWRNFRSFEDTEWLTIRPLTVIIGPNGSGKTSLLAPFLLLKQTLQSADRSLALKTRGELFDAGSFADAIRDGDVHRRISFAFRFHRNETQPSDLKRLGEYPPGEVSLTFSLPAGHTFPALHQYDVLDTYGRLLLRRVLTKDGKYGLRGVPLGTMEKHLKSAIRKTPPTRFLFTPEPVLRETFEKEIKSKPQHTEGADGRVTVEEVRIEKSAGLYFAITSFVASWIEHLLRDVSFVGPLREHPRRVYVLSGEHPPHVGTRGQWAPEIVYRQRDVELLKKVNEWIDRFDFGVRLERKPCGDDAFSITLRRDGEGLALNLADTGFGLSQVLPLIVQSFYSNRRSVILAEQPEIHLNPRLQALLADLFAEVAKSGRGVLLETHSEHLLLRLRRLVAERHLKARDVSLLYVEASGGRSAVREIPVHSNGHIDLDQWPKGFFEDSLRESLGLASAQAGSVSRAQ